MELEPNSPVLLIAMVSLLGGAVLAGAGAWLTWGRKMMTKDEHDAGCPYNAVTKQELDDHWSLRAEPIRVEITHLKEGQLRVEKKVDRLVRGLLKDEND